MSSRGLTRHRHCQSPVVLAFIRLFGSQHVQPPTVGSGYLYHPDNPDNLNNSATNGGRAVLGEQGIGLLRIYIGYRTPSRTTAKAGQESKQ